MQRASAALRNCELQRAGHFGEERLHLRSVAYEFLDVERKLSFFWGGGGGSGWTEPQQHAAVQLSSKTALPALIGP